MTASLGRQRRHYCPDPVGPTSGTLPRMTPPNSDPKGGNHVADRAAIGSRQSVNAVRKRQDTDEITASLVRRHGVHALGSHYGCLGTWQNWYKYHCERD